VDFKALTGDKSDNIPGVAGIGDKTAVSLLKTYNDLDGIYAHLEEIPGSARKKLEVGRESAYLSRKLAAIVTDLRVSLDMEQARCEQFEPQAIEAIFRELEFRSLLPRLTSLEQLYGKAAPRKGQQLSLFGGQEIILSGETPETLDDMKVTVVDTPETLQALVERLKTAAMISFDTETTSTDQMRAELVGISLAVSAQEAYYIPVGHRPGASAEPLRQLPVETVIEALRGPFTDANIPKTGHNLKYDFVMLARYGLRASPLSFDTMIAEWVINPASRNLGLKNLAWVRLDIQMTHIEELIGKGKNQITMAEVPIPQAAAYAAADAAIVFPLMDILEGDLKDCKGDHLFQEVEMPLVTVLADMEMAGISLDADFLKQMSQDLSVRMGAIEAKIFESCGGPFNLNSPPQLSDVLFNRLGINPPDRTAKTATGFYSTSADVLESLRGKHQVVDWVLEYRELSKLKSTYLDALPLQLNPLTGRVHTSYSQTGSVTGRIASSEPNLQNIPIRSELGRKVRKAFIASSGHVLLSVDYSQVELRIVASIAEDEAMLATFRADLDIHAATAAAIYGVPLNKDTKQMRSRAKGINFGLIYGMSAFGLTRYTDLTLAESEDFMKAYFRQFPGVKSYLDGVRKQAAEQGYVETLLGRRRYFPGLQNQRDRNIRNREEREAINAPIQGTAADIMKIAMLRVPQALARSGLSARMLLQVHDEIVLECTPNELHATAKVVKEVMENAYDLAIPLKSEAKYGTNWGELEPLESV
jgi:DNA polymerase-1